MNQGFVRIDKEDYRLIDYLNWTSPETLKVEMRSEMYYFLNQETSKKFVSNLREQVKKKEVEIKSMYELIGEVDYQVRIKHVK
ncbi:hypothetical protein D3C74_475030 [compost metagenome]